MNATTKALQTEYRRFHAWIRTQPEDAQWQYGARLKELQARFLIELEAAQVRNN